jgi:hypothetical protein
MWRDILSVADLLACVFSLDLTDGFYQFAVEELGSLLCRDFENYAH